MAEKADRESSPPSSHPVHSFPLVLSFRGGETPALVDGASFGERDRVGAKFFPFAIRASFVSEWQMVVGGGPSLAAQESRRMIFFKKNRIGLSLLIDV